MAFIINGVVMSKENISFLKSVQEKDRAARIAKIKNFSTPNLPEMPKAQKVKTKISHAARKARRVALSIAADPRNRGTSRSK